MWKVKYKVIGGNVFQGYLAGYDNIFCHIIKNNFSCPLLVKWEDMLEILEFCPGSSLSIKKGEE